MFVQVPGNDTREQIREIFQQYGTIVDLNTMPPKKPGAMGEKCSLLLCLHVVRVGHAAYCRMFMVIFAPAFGSMDAPHMRVHTHACLHQCVHPFIPACMPHNCARRPFIGAHTWCTHACSYARTATCLNQLLTVALHAACTTTGCAFVTYSTWAAAEAAVKAIDGKYTMPGGPHALTVRFADAKPAELAKFEARGTKRGAWELGSIGGMGAMMGGGRGAGAGSKRQFMGGMGGMGRGDMVSACRI